MRPSLRLLHCSSLRIAARAGFWRTCASHPQASRTDPPLLPPPPTPTGPRAGRASLVLQAADAQGGVAVTTTQKPRPGSPPPPPARASCHVAQGRGARHCGAGLGEGRTKDRLPADSRSGFAHLGPKPITRGRSQDFSSQSDTKAEQAAGKPTPPEGRVAGRPRGSHFH